MKDRKAWPIILSAGALASWGLFWLLQKSRLMPVAAAAEAAPVDRAFTGMLVLMSVGWGFMAAYLFYCLIRFRAESPGEEGPAIHHSAGHRLEAVWVSASLVLTLGLAAFGCHELANIVGNPQADLNVQVTASQFSWEFYYPEHKQFGARLTLPRGKRVRLQIGTSDVVHSFWVPEFRLKQDALPGKIIPLIITPTLAGSYELRCAELCGMDHTTMTAYVDVVEPEDFESKMKGEEW